MWTRHTLQRLLACVSLFCVICRCYRFTKGMVVDLSDVVRIYRFQLCGCWLQICYVINLINLHCGVTQSSRTWVAADYQCTGWLKI